MTAYLDRDGVSGRARAPAVSRTWLALVPAHVELSSSPPERPAPDPKREEHPRERDKSSTERVDQ